MVDPRPGDEGRGVVYTPRSGGPREDGVVVGWNDRYVFVRYGRQRSGTATERADLEWEHTP